MEEIKETQFMPNNYFSKTVPFTRYKTCGSVKEAIGLEDLTQYGAKKVRLNVQ